MSERDHGLDVARAGAMAGVILTHALASYTVTPIGWAVTDGAATLAADGAMWVFRAFLMPVFFLLAGHLARRSITSHGFVRFLRSRALRIAAPLVVLLVPMSLAMNALWDWGAAAQVRPVVSAVVPALESSGSTLTLAHLWYLHYLLLFSVVGALLWRLRVTVPARVARVIPLAIVVVVSAVLLLAGGLQLDTPLGFAIDPGFALTYGGFFAWGWHVEMESLAHRARMWGFVAAGAFGALLSDLLASADGAEPRPHAMVASAVFSVAMTAAFIGVLLRIGDQIRVRASGQGRGGGPGVRWLAEASYWTYIVHLPLVVVLQIALLSVAAPAFVEVALIAGLAVTAALISYQLLIRRTVLARFVG